MIRGIRAINVTFYLYFKWWRGRLRWWERGESIAIRKC